MKKYLPFFLVALILPSFVSAQATLPDAKVWYTPIEAKAGEPIQLNTLVYNPQKEDITFIVSFENNQTELVKANLLVPKETAKIISAPWLMPSINTVVTATVTSAVTKQKKEITALHGIIGVTTVGQTVIPSNFSLPPVIKNWYDTAYTALEAYRVAQVSHFTELRDRARAALGIGGKVKNIEDKYEQAAGTTPNPIVPEKQAGPLQYVTYIYSMSLASLFGHKTIFYITVLLLPILIIRFILKRFI